MINTENDAVLFERIGKHIALVTLNRESKRNAVNGDITQGLTSAIKAIENDIEIRVAILAAKGDVFCAGADLAEIAKGGVASLMTEEGGFGGFVSAKKTKPWIAAVSGKAFGGGCEFALACDMIIASESAEFGLPEVKRGLIAAAGGVFRITRALPRALGIEMVVTGKPISAKKALEHGMINRIVDNSFIIAESLKLAEDIAANAPLSVQASLSLARQSADLNENELWGISNLKAKKIMSSEDAKEGPSAFIQKRTPQWTGR